MAPPLLARHLQRGVAGEAAHPRLQTAYVIGIGLGGLAIDARGRDAAPKQLLRLLALERTAERRVSAGRARGHDLPVVAGEAPRGIWRRGRGFARADGTPRLHE